jgi:hypothetical protein
MLDKINLTNNLIKLFQDPGKGLAGPAKAWADAYLQYVMVAQAGPLFRSTALDAVSRASLQSLLITTFARTYPSRVVDEAAQDLQTALVAFWLSPPQLFIPIPTPATVGVIALVPPTLAGLLLPVLRSNVALKGSDGARTAAKRVASIIDAWTRTIIVAVTVTPPGPPPVPTPLT